MSLPSVVFTALAVFGKNVFNLARSQRSVLVSDFYTGEDVIGYFNNDETALLHSFERHKAYALTSNPHSNRS